MRYLLWSVALAWSLASAPALAGEVVNLTGRTTGVFQYPSTNTICLAFETKEQKRFLVCDDVTSKEVIEKLFELGKKDTECRIEGTVAKKNGEDVYLNVTQVAQGN